MGEQNTQEISPEPVQMGKKKRSPEEKHGHLRWILTLLERMDAKLEKVEATQRVILNGLKGAGYFHFSVPLIQKYAVVDQVDLEILERVFEAGKSGVFPKDVAKNLGQYGLAYYDVSRRIVRMNKRLTAETGEILFEKRGHRWALTRFAFDLYGASCLEDVRGNSVPVESEEVE